MCLVMVFGMMPITAVFAWTAPTLSGDGGGTWNIQLSAEGVLSWDEQQNATSYTIEVDKTAMGSTLTKIENINGTSYNLINRFKELKIENGTYYFQIKANGTDTTSNTISFKYVSPQDKLYAPLNLRWEGTIAKWDSVANATKYTVNLYTDDGYLQLSKTATTTQYDWESEATAGRWFEVVATADGYRDSNAAESPRYGNYTWTAPTLTGGKAEWNVTLSDDGMLRWNDRGSATYDIEVDETAMGGTVTNIYDINTNAYNLINRFKTLKLENGTYYFTIKANDTSETSGTISFRYVSPESKLSAPQNLRWDGTVAKWDSVANATGYTVILYTSSGSVQLNKTTSVTQYDWTTEAADGRWFEVVATANNYRDSNPAEGPKYVVVSYSIGAYPYDATVSQTQAGGQVYLTTDAGTDGWSSDGYIKTATEGSTVTLNAMPATGYKFVEWRQGTAGATISTDANYQFNASETKYLYAVFETISSTTYNIELTIFDITYTANDGGTVSIQTNKGSSVAGQSATKSATENTAVTITAVPKQGYEFVAWKVSTPYANTAFSTEATYTFTVTESVVDTTENPPLLFLYAVFQETQPQATTYEINCVSHNLSSNETGGKVMLETDKGGTGYAASQQKYATENTTVRLRAVAEPGYQFVAWRKGSPTDANATVSTDANYQFTATEAVWMYAVFEYTPECTIDCTVFDITGGINNGQIGVGGTVSIQTDKGSVGGATPLPIQATRNSSVTINAVADQGYEFLGWKKESPYVQEFFSVTPSYNFTINEVLYLYAVFQETQSQPTTYEVTVTSGTATPTSAQQGATVTITANQPEQNKEFDKWIVNAGEVTLADETAMETTFEMGTANVEVTATYKDVAQNPATYTVTVTSGTATPTSAQQGATVTITANQPEQNKEFDKWIVNAGEVTLADETAMETTFEMGTANVEVTATYKDIAQNPTTYTVTFNSNSESAVADITGVTSGSTIQKPTNPTRSGYTFVGWYKEAELTNEFNFATDTITSDTTLFAKWKVKQSSSGGGGSSVTKYEIKVTAGKGGKISPETTKVEKGDSKKFTITADEGYEIEDVLVDGKSVGVVESYKFEKVKEKHTIEATFKKIEEKEELKDTEENTNWENPFEDVSEDAWYYEAVEFANENNLFSGMSAKEFGPSVAMTRGMFVTVLSKLNGGEIDGEANFVDVDPNAYYAKPVAWAYTKGIVNGVGNNKFAPNMSITREQLAVMMYNYMVVEQIDKPASLVEFPEFADAEEISDWATNAVNVMRATGLMSGKPNNKFDPKGTATRAEVATILMNFCK